MTITHTCHLCHGEPFGYWKRVTGRILGLGPLPIETYLGYCPICHGDSERTSEVPAMSRMFELGAASV